MENQGESTSPVNGKVLDSSIFYKPAARTLVASDNAGAVLMNWMNYGDKKYERVDFSSDGNANAGEGPSSGGDTAKAVPPPAPSNSPDSEQSPTAESKNPVQSNQQVKKPPEGYDRVKAVEYLDKNSKDDSTGYCAKAVRQSVQHGGLNLSNYPEHAKEYGPYLEKAGLSKVSKENYVPQKGDIAVIQPFDKGKSGHIQMYNGKNWVSDFKQKREFYPSQKYEDAKTAYEIYR